jgi:hypothetical protein
MASSPRPDLTTRRQAPQEPSTATAGARAHSPPSARPDPRERRWRPDRPAAPPGAAGQRRPADQGAPTSRVPVQTLGSPGSRTMCSARPTGWPTDCHRSTQAQLDEPISAVRQRVARSAYGFTLVLAQDARFLGSSARLPWKATRMRLPKRSWNQDPPLSDQTASSPTCSRTRTCLWDYCMSSSVIGSAGLALDAVDRQQVPRHGGPPRDGWALPAAHPTPNGPRPDRHVDTREIGPVARDGEGAVGKRTTKPAIEQGTQGRWTLRCGRAPHLRFQR